MSELYRAIAGSPITYLSSDISAAQTTISIADDSALPDAPNICTIGYGENIETIRYGAKSNGVLQNVTRGIEGTPRAWPAGTEVARFFTAYDYNALIENFNSHLAESSSKHIKESGENENGKYIRFDDGTQICYARVDLIYSSPNALRQKWNYPANFTRVPSVNLNIGTTVNITPHIREIGTQQAAPITTTYTDLYQVRIENMTTFSQNDSLPAYVVAVGRWK